MKRREWKPEQKALIALEGLKGRPVGELCAEHEIRQAQYYQWRDQFLANGAKAFEPAGAPQRRGRLERENARLNILVGERALELQKKPGDPGARRGPYAKVAARNAARLVGSPVPPYDPTWELGDGTIAAASHCQGAGAIHAAMLAGARRIVLLGFVGGADAHGVAHHGDAEPKAPPFWRCPEQVAAEPALGRAPGAGAYPGRAFAKPSARPAAPRRRGRA